MVISNIFVYKSTYTDLVIYVMLSVFEGNDLLRNLRLSSRPSKRGIFQNIKASNFGRSIDCKCSICPSSCRIHKQRSLIMITKISTHMISDRSFDVDNLLIIHHSVQLCIEK